MMRVEFLKLSHLTENDVTINTYRTVIVPVFIHMRLNKQEFVKALDLYVIKNSYDNVNLIKREIIKLVKTTITSKKKLGFVKPGRKTKFIQLAEKFCHCVQEHPTEMYTVHEKKKLCMKKCKW